MNKVISTAEAPLAIGPYSQAVSTNNMIFISGQLPIDSLTGILVGNTVAEQTQQVFKNLKAIIESAGFLMENIVKTTVLLADIEYFSAMNEVYSNQFSENYPARSTFAVKELPKKAFVEIEAIAVH